MNKRGHGDMSAVMDLLNTAKANGLISYTPTKNGYVLKSSKYNLQEFIHRGERSLHYARRFINKLTNNEDDNS